MLNAEEDSEANVLSHGRNANMLNNQTQNEPQVATQRDQSFRGNSKRKSEERDKEENEGSDAAQPKRENVASEVFDNGRRSGSNRRGRKKKGCGNQIIQESKENVANNTETRRHGNCGLYRQDYTLSGGGQVVDDTGGMNFSRTQAKATNKRLGREGRNKRIIMRDNGMPVNNAQTQMRILTKADTQQAPQNFQSVLVDDGNITQASFGRPVGNQDQRNGRQPGSYLARDRFSSPDDPYPVRPPSPNVWGQKHNEPHKSAHSKRFPGFLARSPRMPGMRMRNPGQFEMRMPGPYQQPWRNNDQRIPNERFRRPPHINHSRHAVIRNRFVSQRQQCQESMSAEFSVRYSTTKQRGISVNQPQTKNSYMGAEFSPQNGGFQSRNSPYPDQPMVRPPARSGTPEEQGQVHHIPESQPHYDYDNQTYEQNTVECDNNSVQWPNKDSKVGSATDDYEQAYDPVQLNQSAEECTVYNLEKHSQLQTESGLTTPYFSEGQQSQSTEQRTAHFDHQLFNQPPRSSTLVRQPRTMNPQLRMQSCQNKDFWQQQQRATQNDKGKIISRQYIYREHVVHRSPEVTEKYSPYSIGHPLRAQTISPQQQATPKLPFSKTPSEIIFAQRFEGASTTDNGMQCIISQSPDQIGQQPGEPEETAASGYPQSECVFEPNVNVPTFQLTGRKNFDVTQRNFIKCPDYERIISDYMEHKGEQKPECGDGNNSENTETETIGSVTTDLADFEKLSQEDSSSLSAAFLSSYGLSYSEMQFSYNHSPNEIYEPIFEDSRNANFYEFDTAGNTNEISAYLELNPAKPHNPAVLITKDMKECYTAKDTPQYGNDQNMNLKKSNVIEQYNNIDYLESELPASSGTKQNKASSQNHKATVIKVSTSADRRNEFCGYTNDGDDVGVRNETEDSYPDSCGTFSSRTNPRPFTDAVKRSVSDTKTCTSQPNNNSSESTPFQSKYRGTGIRFKKKSLTVMQSGPAPPMTPRSILIKDTPVGNRTSAQRRSWPVSNPTSMAQKQNHDYWDGLPDIESVSSVTEPVHDDETPTKQTEFERLSLGQKAEEAVASELFDNSPMVMDFDMSRYMKFLPNNQDESAKRNQNRRTRRSLDNQTPLSELSEEPSWSETAYGDGKWSLDNCVIAGDSITKPLKLAAPTRDVHIVAAPGCTIFAPTQDKWNERFWLPLKERLGEKPEIKILILHIGTNDIGSKTKTSARFVFGTAMKLIRQLWSSLPNLRIVCSSILPRSANRLNPNADVNNVLSELNNIIYEVNDKIEEQTKKDSRLGFLDNHEAYQDNLSAYYEDGLHLSTEGSRILAKRFRNRLEEELQALAERE